DHGRTTLHDSEKPRHDCSSRLSARISEYSTTVRLLRREARYSRFYRLASFRIAARQDQRTPHDGPTAGAEYTTIRMGQEPFASPATARRCRPRYLLGRAPPSSRIKYRVFVCESDHRDQDFSRPSRSLPRAAWLRRTADGRTCRSQSSKQPLDAASERFRRAWPIRRSGARLEHATLTHNPSWRAGARRDSNCGTRPLSRV